MKPLLAATLEEDTFHKLKYPLFVSPKLDGIRAIVKDGVVYSRKLKPIRNEYIQNIIGKPEFNGLDGELIVGAMDNGMAFRHTTSGVMSIKGEPDFTYMVFDRHDIPSSTFEVRYQTLSPFRTGRIRRLSHIKVTSQIGFSGMEEEYVKAGYEGIMLRDPKGLYKHGRSTLNEGILMKFKRFKQEEAKVIGFLERKHNTNKAKKNALGNTERSMHQENMIPMGTLGSLLVQDIKNPEATFSIGTGFDDLERKRIWENREKFLDKIVTYKFFAYGEYDAPRFPVYKGFRHEDDM